MLKKLGKRITNNFGLKLLAALFAIVLWVAVINIDDPTIILPFTTSVTAENTSYLTAQNKYFEVLDGKNTVTFNASAERSILTEMSNSDFSATADMEKIEYNEDTGNYRVPVTITPKRYNNKVTVTSKQLYLGVSLEDLGTSQKVITPVTRGTVADGCALGTLEIVGSNLLKVSKQLYLGVSLEDLGTSQKVITPVTRGTVADGCALGTLEIVGSNLLKVSGPASIISQIDTAVAAINVDGVSTDVTDSVVPVLYDADGNVIDTTRLKLSLSTVTVSAQVLSTKDVALSFETMGKPADGYMLDADGNVIDTTRLKLSLSTVTVSAQVLSTKDVALSFETMGKPADGYMLTGIEYPLETVRIKGESATLNTVNKISIPKEVLEVTDITENLVRTVDITSYLPEGTALVLASDAKVDVTVKVEAVVKESFEVPTANLGACACV